MPDLIHDIDAFCKRHNISASQFGMDALKDKPFVYQLRGGRRVWPETAAKVRDFMASYQPAASEKVGEET